MIEDVNENNWRRCRVHKYQCT